MSLRCRSNGVSQTLLNHFRRDAEAIEICSETSAKTIHAFHAPPRIGVMTPRPDFRDAGAYRAALRQRLTRHQYNVSRLLFPAGSIEIHAVSSGTEFTEAIFDITRDAGFCRR